jgi:hypothetical protein
MNRERHFATVPRWTPSSSAISVLEPPRAQRNTTRDRNANAWAVFGRRDHRRNVSASSSLRTSSASFGFGIPQV